MNRETLIDNARQAVLTALDEWADENDIPGRKGRRGWTDADLPALFNGIDAHIDRVIARNGLVIPDHAP